MAYTKILVAVEMGEEGIQVLERARALGNVVSAELYCVHVIEPIFIDTGSDLILDLSSEIEQKRQQVLQKQLHSLAERFAIPAEHAYLKEGSVKAEVMALAAEQGCDLIIVGSHGRHGLALLLGSTANAILHHAQCDVLAVRIEGA